MKFIFFFSLLFSASISWSLPGRPTDPEHPASVVYPFAYKKIDLKIKNRPVSVFMPQSKLANDNRKFPVLVFGHGQAIDVSGYELSFEHFAKKGLAVVFPGFDKGFFDQDWPRMADDFNDLTSEVLKSYPQLDADRLIYSGHSKGGYVGLMAAGSKNLQSLGLRPASMIFFAPAGYDANFLNRLSTEVPLTLVWSDQDSVIKKSLIEEIYEKSPVAYKQMIQVTSYNELAADHFFTLSKSFFFGGKNGVSPLHFFAFWKWALGAAWDLEATNRRTNPYLYGNESLTTGDEALRHKLLKKSW